MAEYTKYTIEHTAELRLVHRSIGPTQTNVLQQRCKVVIDIGSPKERNRTVWLDVPVQEEYTQERFAREDFENGVLT